MSVTAKHKLTLVTIAYWFLLTYIIAALLWWFIALNNQNIATATMQLQQLNKDDVAYNAKTQQIQSLQQRKTTQYIGEGISFLAVILIGAVFIYRATRKQIKFAQQQQNFMMAVTHELKTPIAVTQLNLQTIKKHQLDSTKQQQIIDNTLVEVNRLNTLCNNILWAAQLDAGSYITKNEKFNISNIVTNCTNNIANRLKQQVIIATIEPNVYLQTDELMIEMLVNNLLENAIKYSSPNTQIFVDLHKNNNAIILAVKDEGIGISDDEKQKIFEKFYRVGSEATRKTKGTGLGLYLCKKIVDAHHAQIVIENNKPQGTIFIVTFKA